VQELMQQRPPLAAVHSGVLVLLWDTVMVVVLLLQVLHRAPPLLVQLLQMLQLQLQLQLQLR
jgi:hypothetical protein